MSFAALVASLTITPAKATEINASGDCLSPQVNFALGELKQAATSVESDYTSLNVRFVEDSGLQAEAYRIEANGAGHFTLYGGDPAGLMYGGLALAESIQFKQNIDRIRSQSASPYLEFRALKINFPLDARTPSYDDTGDSAKWNIETMWDFDFWTAQLDAMARFRYNAITLWNPHPFPSLVKLEDYPKVALNDVCGTTYRYPLDYHPRYVAQEVLDNLVILKEITIEEKIAFWRKVMAYAKDRGIQFFIITWNVHLDGAYGKYGIDASPDNAITIDYLRSSVRETLLAYPDLAGIGVTAGEKMKQFPNNEAKEAWLWDAYGVPVQDVVKLQPDRQVRFIHRDWQTGLKPVLDAFTDYPGPFDTSFKYAKARIHSMPNPIFADPLIEDMRQNRIKAWWNLRNDDLYCLRWGDPSYARSMIKNMPPEQTIGFHMGSDGYVWARNFALLDEAQRGQMEIDRHWYNFMIWGRLGYDPSLDRRFFEAALHDRFPEADPSLLYDTWTHSSKIMPQINRFFFKRGDWMFSPEGCHFAKEPFLTVEDFINGEPMSGAPEISIPEFLAQADHPGAENSRNPLEVAQNLDAFADQALDGVERLRRQSMDISSELSSVLTDIEAMSWMGRYYADKIRGATHLAWFRKTGNPQRQAAAIGDLENAARDWRVYARLASSQYRPQVLARGQVLDWQATTEYVDKEIDYVRQVSRSAPPVPKSTITPP
ncbi:MAG: hypothetical protein AB3N64_08830 [Puniceicoccaceae bacterium]